MRVSDFYFDLPDELIARYPQKERSASRLLKLDGNSGEFSHHHFKDVLDFVNEGDLLVFNNTRVIPARMYGRKSSGGKVEVLIERVLDEKSCLAHVRASKAPKEGSELILGEDKLGEGNGVQILCSIYNLILMAHCWIPYSKSGIFHYRLILIVRMKMPIKSDIRPFIVKCRGR